MYRIVISELLYNRLGWANNKQKNLNLPIQWPAYGEFSQKLGEWKWREVKLESDYQGFFKEKMERGYILTDGKSLKKPNFGYEKWGDYVQVPGSAWDIYVAEEEVIEKREIIKETLMTADMSVADYSIVDYIGSPDANIWEQMGHRVHPTSYGNGGGRDCLGCLCGGGSHGDPNYNFSRTYNFTSGGSLVLKTRGSGEQTCTIPEQGGKVIFSAQGNSGSLVLETEKITREIKFKEAKKTNSQEIDQAELESKEEEQEFENEEELDLEKTEQEKAEQGLGNEKSLEKEQELAKELEKEGEQEDLVEKAQEQEKETEKEDENEKIEEQFKEQAKEQESKEQEDENEGENEGEDEDEL